jgi:uncharacterized protein (DUF302 family)
MSPRRYAATLLLVLWGCLTTAFAAKPGYAVYESSGDFDTVMAAAKLAIQERGMFVNNIMHLSAMLERTGKDLGFNRKIYAKAESIEFCSAVLSRKMMEEDPGQIVNCPFTIAVYTLPGKPGKTYVAHRVIPAEVVANSPAMAEIAKMLKEVAQSAASW